MLEVIAQAIFGPGLAAVAALWVLGYLAAVSLGSMAEGWPTTEGRVETVRNRSIWPASGDILGDLIGNIVIPHFRVGITYTFDFHGAPTRGRRISFGAGAFHSYTASASRRIAERYAKGAVVRVYHHPRRPRLCVLEPGLHEMLRPANLIWIAGWVFLLMIGVANTLRW